MAHEKKLTPKQRMFVEQYLIDLNGGAAYQRAGYKARGDVADVNASRLLRNAHITAAIEAAMKLRSARTEITQDRVLRELSRIAFFDIGKAFTPEGDLLPLDQMDEDTRRALAGLEVNELRDNDGDVVGIAKKIKLADKLRALELLGRHLGMFDTRIKVSGDEANPLALLIKQIQGSAFNPVKLQPAHNQFVDEQTSTH